MMFLKISTWTDMKQKGVFIKQALKNKQQQQQQKTCLPSLKSL